MCSLSVSAQVYVNHGVVYLMCVVTEVLMFTWPNQQLLLRLVIVFIGVKNFNSYAYFRYVNIFTMKPHRILQSHANALFSMHSRVYKSFDLNDVGDE